MFDGRLDGIDAVQLRIFKQGANRADPLQRKAGIDYRGLALRFCAATNGKVIGEVQNKRGG